MFSLSLRPRQDRRAHNPRQAARARLQSTIRQDRLEVSAPQLSALHDSMLRSISEHLAVAPEFAEFALQSEGEEVFLVARVRLEKRG